MRLLLLVLLLSCGSRPGGMRPSTLAPDDSAELTRQPVSDARPDVPLGQLPREVAPIRYSLALQIDPNVERFSGTAEIAVRVAAPLRWAWIHGKELAVSDASIVVGERTIAATYEQVDDQGVASLHFDEVVPAGEGTLRLRYDAPFNRALRGLYRVDDAGASYAFTQFEAISARLAFPCFDEPSFKTPFDMTMTVRADDVAAFNTPIAEERVVGTNKTVRFATTLPMPTYLVAMAVGPLDVVEHEAIPASELRGRAIPLRGLAARGKGEKLAYALANTGRLLEELESYFGIAYPYEKLDIVAVPDFAAGAMENVGLITFREPLLLLDDTAPEWQRRAYAYVMAHELAHQWFGNLVTMPWWDDIWLNEAFATWMGYKAVHGVHPEYQAPLQLLERAQGAMSTDSLVSARQIRQPIETHHDIRNAFDSITYSKGGGVLSMFEQWIGEDRFRDGIRRYLEAHRFGTATYADFLDALSSAAGRDVATPFSTFLFQPGLPFIDVKVECGEGGNRVRFAQSRYLPVGSGGSRDATWKLPVCVRTSDGEPQCVLLSEAQGELPLTSCPEWIMPNANGAGYYRFNLEPEQLTRLRERGWSQLDVREQLAAADSIQAAFDNGTMTLDDALSALEPLARSSTRQIASVPMRLLGFVIGRLLDDTEAVAARRFVGQLYAPAFRELGWQSRRGAEEDGETQLRRAEVIGALASVARDARVRRDAVRRAHTFLGYGPRGDNQFHPDAVDSNLVGLVLAVAVEDGDAAFFDHVFERFLATEDARRRAELLRALASTTDPDRAARVRSLTLDARVRVNEMMSPLFSQMGNKKTRDAAWAWVKDHFGDLASRLEMGAGSLPELAEAFCDETAAADVEAYFGSWIDAVQGGPRTLANSLEQIRLCMARVEAHAAAAHARF